MIQRIDPTLPIRSSATGEQITALPLLPYRAAVAALGLLGLIASGLLLSGLHAMLAYAVVKRQREIGIRVALGANRGSVIHAVLSRVLMILGIGMTLGAVLPAGTGPLVSSMVLGVSPRGAGAGRGDCCLLAVDCAAVVRGSDPAIAAHRAAERITGGLMRTLSSRIGELLFRRRREERLSDEIGHHLDLLVEDLKRGWHG